MEVRIELSELKNMLKNAATLGAQEYARMLHPEEDNIKQAEALRILNGHGLPRKLLSDWLEYGHIHKVKSSSGTVWFSRREITTQIAAIEARNGNVSYF